MKINGFIFIKPKQQNKSLNAIEYGEVGHLAVGFALFIHGFDFIYNLLICKFGRMKADGDAFHFGRIHHL